MSVPRNRFAGEAAKRAQSHVITVGTAGMAIGVAIGAVLSGQPIDPPLRARIASAPLVAAVSLVMAIRWRRRAAWIERTDKWWERLDEAPSLSL